MNTRIEGRLVLDAAAQSAEHWPLEPGDYEAMLLLYDAYDVAARVLFSVAGPVPAPEEPAVPAWNAACTAPDGDPDATSASASSFFVGG